MKGEGGPTRLWLAGDERGHDSSIVILRVGCEKSLRLQQG